LKVLKGEILSVEEFEGEVRDRRTPGFPARDNGEYETHSLSELYIYFLNICGNLD
jgi:hypothetical protein